MYYRKIVALVITLVLLLTNTNYVINSYVYADDIETTATIELKIIK